MARHGRTMLARRPSAAELEDEWRAEPDVTGEIPALRFVAGPQPRPPAALSERDAPAPGRPSVPAADPREAVAAFRSHAVALALTDESADSDRSHSLVCAESLLGLAAGDHEAELAAILLADPAVTEATWTVACYQIGDLSPSALQDFPTAAPAVRTLAGCDSAAHVASELIVSNGDGVRWTALVRAGQEVRYQPLGPRSARAASAEVLLGVRHRWEDRLLIWAASPTDGLDAAPLIGPPIGPPAESPVDRSAVPPVVPNVPVGPGTGPAPADPIVVGVVLGQVLEKVRAIEERLPGTGSSRIDAITVRDDYGRPSQEVEQLRLQVETLLSETNGLRSELGLMRTEHSALRVENSSLRVENSSLRSENSSLRTENSALRAAPVLTATEVR